MRLLHALPVTNFSCANSHPRLLPSGGNLLWQDVPDPAGSAVATRYQLADTRTFLGGEGIDIVAGKVVFTTKWDSRVWRYDPAANTLEIIYYEGNHPTGILGGVDQLTHSEAGVIYVCEDEDDMQIHLLREDGSVFPVVQIEGNPDSEMTGASFDPSGTRLYFSDQRTPGRTFEVEGPWEGFTRPGTLLEELAALSGKAAG